jgi:hypothetical protein
VQFYAIRGPSLQACGFTPQFERATEEFAEIGISFVCVLRRLHVKQPLAVRPLKMGMNYRDFSRADQKKNRGRLLKRHRLEDGIPKEEEEKPRR